MSETLIIVTLYVLIGLFAGVSFFAIRQVSRIGRDFIIAQSEVQTQFLEHLENFESLAFVDAKEKRDLLDFSIHRAEQAQSQPNTTSTTAESEDFGEFGTGNRRMRNGTSV